MKVALEYLLYIIVFIIALPLLLLAAILMVLNTLLAYVCRN